MITSSSRVVGFLVGAVLLAAAPAVGAAEPSQPPAVVETDPIKVTKEKDGVRLTMRSAGPLAAGQPARVRTRVKNTGDKPILWLSGPDGILVGGSMTDATWRLGESRAKPATLSDMDLKDWILRDLEPTVEPIILPFKLREVDGVEVDQTGSVAFPQRLRPGQTVELVHEWGGFAQFERSHPATLGLPPSGPVRLGVSAYYNKVVGPNDQVARAREISTETETAVVGGRPDDLLHPLEAVDAALDDPGFAELMEAPDFTRYDEGYIACDNDNERWYVGSCGLRAGEKNRYWRLGVVEPVDGDVLELIEGHGNRTCDPGTWPASMAAAPSPSPTPEGAAAG